MTRRFWWGQEMDLEEGMTGGVDGGRGGVLPRQFYNKTGDEVGAGRTVDENRPDPLKH